MRDRRRDADRALTDLLATPDVAVVEDSFVEVRSVPDDEVGVTEMLIGLYQRYACDRGWNCELLDVRCGDARAIRWAVMSVTERGGTWSELAGESGLHRLRHGRPLPGPRAVFAEVFVYPDRPFARSDAITEADLRMDHHLDLTSTALHAILTASTGHADL